MVNELFRWLPALAAGPSEDVLIAIPGIILVFGIPIIAILTHHQRKMAELVHRNLPLDNKITQQLDSMQAQINELKGLVQDHIIRTDRSPIETQVPPPLEDRLRGQ